MAMPSGGVGRGSLRSIRAMAALARATVSFSMAARPGEVCSAWRRACASRSLRNFTSSRYARSAVMAMNASRDATMAVPMKTSWSLLIP